MIAGSPTVEGGRGTVYLASGDEPFRREVGRALRGLNVRVVDSGSIEEVPLVPRNRTDRVLLLGTTTAGGDSTFYGLAALREVDQATPVLLCTSAAARELRILPQFVRSGVDGMILIGFEGWEQEVRRQVARHLDHALPESFLQSALPGQQNDVRAEQAWMGRRSHRGVHIDEVAGWFRVARSTLRIHHRRDGSPSPHRWLRLSRLLHVAHQLDETLFDVGTVARRLGFPSLSDLSMFVHRMTGQSPTALRAQGALRRALLIARSERSGSRESKQL